MSILSCINENANLIQIVCSVCMLLITILYVVFTWKQSKYTKQAFLESIKQSKEDRQPFIIPKIDNVSGVAFDTSDEVRVQLNFHCKMENVGDSSAVSVYALLYAKMQYRQEKELVYSHLIPRYNYSIGVTKTVEEDIHFETSQFRDIVEDLEISAVKNRKRIETNPYMEPYKGPEIILRVLYKNMMDQWFESELEQELLEITYKPKGENKRGKMVTNKNVSDGDSYEGCMINPCYSRMNRKMVSDEYVKAVLNDCGKNAVTSRFEPENCV